MRVWVRRLWTSRHAPTRKVAIGAATFVALTLLTGIQYLPSRLPLSVGGVSPRDIVASLPGPSRGCWRRCSPPIEYPELEHDLRRGQRDRASVR